MTALCKALAACGYTTLRVRETLSVCLQQTDRKTDRQEAGSCVCIYVLPGKGANVRECAHACTYVYHVPTPYMHMHTYTHARTCSMQHQRRCAGQDSFSS